MLTQLKTEVALVTPLPDLGSVNVRIFRNMQEVETLRTFWTSCAGQRDSDLDIFLTACKTSPEILRPHVLVLYRDEKPVVILIGKIVRRRLSFRVGYLTLFNPPANVMTFSYGGLRGNPSSDNCERLVHETIKSLREGEADVALLEHVDTDSDLFRWAKAMPGILFRDYFSPVRPHYMRKLPSSVDQLYAELSGNERSHFRRIAKKLKNDFSGKVRVDRFEDVADLDRTLKVVEGIAKKTWQRKLSRGFNTDAPLLEFLKTQAENGWLRVYTLYVGDEPCAFWIGSVYQQSFFSDFLGYDPEYARYSPGMFLLSQMMEEFCSRGVEMIDFGFSDEEYKRRFANLIWQESSLHIFAPASKGLALSLKKMTANLLHEPARAILDRTNLIQKAKKLWRKTPDKR